MKPSIRAVEAAIAAWNAAEPAHQIVGVSYHETFIELLEAAYAVDLQPSVDAAVEAAIEGATSAISKAFASGQIVAGPNPRNAPPPSPGPCGACSGAHNLGPDCDEWED